MWISDTAIKRPVFATMVIMSFMVLGVVSMTRLGIDLFPEVNFPFVNVTVVYPGAGPEEVETLVTRPIEDAVAGINGVKKVVSNSTEGMAIVCGSRSIPRRLPPKFARRSRQSAASFRRKSKTRRSSASMSPHSRSWCSPLDRVSRPT
jgi:HAE1 family hydrophobic/amphiphilic exporter-1